MDYKDNWEKSKARFSAFWSNELIDRCCISVISPAKGSTWQPEPLPDNPEDKLKYWTDGEWIVSRYKRYFENTYFGGDSFPHVWLNLGAAGIAGYFTKSRFQFENTVWYFPFIEYYDRDFPEFDPDGFLYRKTLELARYLVNESKGSFFVSMPDNSGNADALAHVRGSENVLMDMVTEPEEVHKAVNLIQKIRMETSERVFDIVRDNNEGGSTIGWLHTWGEGKHDQMQCDLSVMISPAMFREFVLPELETQANWLDHGLYHFDGLEQIRHLDMLLSIEKLAAIQWTCVAGQPSPLEFIPVLRRIQQAGKGLVMWVNNKKELESLLQNLSSKGLYLIVNADSEDEARDIVKLAEKLTHE